MTELNIDIDIDQMLEDQTEEIWECVKEDADAALAINSDDEMAQSQLLKYEQFKRRSALKLKCGLTIVKKPKKPRIESQDRERVGVWTQNAVGGCLCPQGEGRGLRLVEEIEWQRGTCSSPRRSRPEPVEDLMSTYKAREEEVMEPQIEMQDPLAKFREHVAAEKEEPRPKMSDAALAKLRTIREQDKFAAIDGERFKNSLSSVESNPANLKRLIERCSRRPGTHDKDHIDRRVAKLGWWIAAGYKLGREIDTVTLIHFFSDLVPQEIAMTDAQFASWNAASAQKRLKSRIARGIEANAQSERPEPVKRLCKAGKKCLWIKNRRAASAGKGAYCTPICRQSAQSRQKRLQAGGISPTNPEVDSRLCVNSGVQGGRQMSYST